MSVKNDKAYKLYKNKQYGTLYITQGNNMLYYKKTPYVDNQWIPLKYQDGSPLKVNTYKTFLTLVRDMSEEDVFLELL